MQDADAAYSRGNNAEGDVHLNNALRALDAATGLKAPDARNMAKALAGTVEPRIHPSCTGACATDAAQAVEEAKKTLAQVASWTSQDMANSPALIDEALNSLKNQRSRGVEGLSSVIEQLEQSMAHHTANDYWFKNSPVHENARNALKTDIAIFDSGRAEQLTGALKTWNGPASSEQQKILDSVVAFGEVSKAYQTLRPEEKVFSQSSLTSVLDGLITSATFLGKVAVSFTPVGDVVDFYETFLGKDFYTGEELSTWGRALTGVGLIWGSGKFWRAAGEEIADIGIKNVAKEANKIVSVYDNVIEIIGENKFYEILKTPKGSRQDPKTYLPTEYIEAHLAKFTEGGSKFMLKENLNTFGPFQIDRTAFILPKNEADQILSAASGDKRFIEKALGLADGQLDTDKLVRVDFPDLKSSDLRIPSGNEAGANPKWFPGGKLPDGNSEAIIDLNHTPNIIWKSSPLEL